MDASEVRAFFERVSPEWDEMRLSFYNERVIDALAEHVTATEMMTVVDVGTGTAFVAAGLASRVALVVGVDSSAAMLAVGRRNLDALGVANVDLAKGDIQDLPLSDASVDGAVTNMALHHAPDPARMVGEMARVTRPGGWVAITDEVEHPYEWMRAEQADIWLGFSQGEVAQLFSSARLVDYGYASLGMQ